MGKTIMGAVVSLDGFMADDNDRVGPLFDWLGNGDVAWSFPGSDGESRSTQASADFMRSQYRDMAANVIGRRLFDMTNGWGGKPAAGEHVFVVTHQAPTDWEYAESRTVHVRRRRREGDCRRQGVRGRPGRRRGRWSDRRPGAQARADRPGGRQPGSDGLRVRPPVLCDRRSGRAAAVGEPDHDRARRPGHPPGLRRQPLRPAVLSVPARRSARDRLSLRGTRRVPAVRESARAPKRRQE
jgi:hypothetical protein